MGFERRPRPSLSHAGHARDHRGRNALDREEQGHALLLVRELQLSAFALRTAGERASSRSSAARRPERRSGARTWPRAPRTTRRSAPREEARRHRPDRRTIVVVTSDHGGADVERPLGRSGLDNTAHPLPPPRSATSKRRTHIPIVIVAPSLLPAGKAVRERVRNTNIAPTILKLLGLERHPHMTGASLVALARGQADLQSVSCSAKGRGAARFSTIGIGTWRARGSPNDANPGP